jgi:hypothetical protein
MDGEAWAWSPDGNLLYVASSRDGHDCIWARRLHPVTKRPVGEPFAVFHSHSARLAFSNQIETTLAVGNNKLVFGMGERTGNIWMAEWKEQWRRGESSSLSFFAIDSISPLRRGTGFEQPLAPHQHWHVDDEQFLRRLAEESGIATRRQRYYEGAVRGQES